MAEDNNNKVLKLFESLNKNLYKSSKAIETTEPILEMFKNILSDIKNIEDLCHKQNNLSITVEDEIKKRDILSLYKKMNNVICHIKSEMDFIYDEFLIDDKILEKYRSYRTYVFENAKKSKEFIKKLIESFDIKELTLRYNVVGTVNLNDTAKLVNGRKSGVDIFVHVNDLELIYSELLKSNTPKFRLISGQLSIYFEKDNILYIEGPSQKIKLCDVTAKEFNGKILDN